MASVILELLIAKSPSLIFIILLTPLAIYKILFSSYFLIVLILTFTFKRGFGAGRAIGEKLGSWDLRTLADDLY